MNFLNGKVQIFLGPTENGAPDNLESLIIDFIDAAQFSLQVAVQEVDSQPIADALDRAVRRKRPGSTTNVSVRLVAEGDYLVESKPVDPRAKVVFTVTSLLPLAPSRGKSSEAHLRHKS